jgi:TetR/AcrR family transcriptional repressor of nem operon
MNKTKTELLNHAELLIRTKGYSAFSYADLSNHVGIKKASIHHHFPTKENLGIILITNYLQKFSLHLDTIDKNNNTVRDKLLGYRSLFTQSYSDGMLPLCCAMAAERATLSPPLQELSRKLFEIQIEWLKRVIESEALEFKENQTPTGIALSFLCAIEGASLLSWILNDNISLLSAFNDVLEQHFPN